MKYLGFGFVLVTCVILIGCGGSKSGDPGGGCCGVPGINVEVVSPAGAAAIDDNPNLTLAITVKVTNDSANAGVTWTLTPAILQNQTETLTGQTAFSATYTPPDYSKLSPGVAFPLQATVTATSVTDPTRSAAIPITIYPPLVFVTTSANLATAFLKTNYTCIQQPISSSVHQITCLASVAGGVGPYTWSLGNSVLPPGLQLAPAPTPAPGATSSTEIIGMPTATGRLPVQPHRHRRDRERDNGVVQHQRGARATESNHAHGDDLVLQACPMHRSSSRQPVEFLLTPGVWRHAASLQHLPPWVSLSPSGVISGTPPANFSATATASRCKWRTVRARSPLRPYSPRRCPSGGNIITLAAADDETLHYLPERQHFCASEHALCVRVHRLRREWSGNFLRQFHRRRQRQPHRCRRHHPLQRRAAGTAAHRRKLHFVR